MRKRIDQYASFRDPAAKVFYLEEHPDFIFRELSSSYLSQYHHLKSSGLSEELINKNWLIPFQQDESDTGNTIILKAKKIKFVSWPYEWSFNQWKDAALLTLKIQYQCLKYGMILKDATPFNIIFDGNKPLFTDLSSFELYKEGESWKALKQFTECFYAPLLLMKYFDAVANELFFANMNGISLQKMSKLLPGKAFLNFNTLLFLVVPGNLSKKLSGNESRKKDGRLTKEKMLNISQQLFSAIDKIHQNKQETKWNNYYEKDTTADYRQEKETIIKQWTKNDYREKTVIDFGCNTGHFSKLVAADFKSVIAFDSDSRSVNDLYLYCKKNKIENISSLTANICQPTPANGWDNKEKASLKERLKADVGVALALVHHLAISNYISFEKMRDFFADCCTDIFIEFIPKEDEKVKLLLLNREDIFDWYTIENFEDSFKIKFTLIKKHTFSNKRVLFHFTKL